MFPAQDTIWKLVLAAVPIVAWLLVRAQNRRQKSGPMVAGDYNKALFAAYRAHEVKDFEVGEAHSRHALACARVLDDEWRLPAVAQAGRMLAFALSQQERYATLIDEVRPILKMLTEEALTEDLLELHLFLQEALSMEGRVSEARAACREAADKVKFMGAPPECRVQLLRIRVDGLLAERKFAKAFDLARRALTEARQSKKAQWGGHQESVALWLLVFVLDCSDRHAEAIPYLEQFRDQCRDMQKRAHAEVYLSHFLSKVGRHAEAIEICSAALPVLETADEGSALRRQVWLARLKALGGDFSGLRELPAISKPVNPLTEASWLEAWALMELSEGRREDALQTLRLGLTKLEGAAGPDDPILCDALRRLSELAAEPEATAFRARLEQIYVTFQ